MLINIEESKKRGYFVSFQTVRQQQAEETGIPQPLRGLNFCFTGTLLSMTRLIAQVKVVELGGSSSRYITTKTTHLVIGEDSGKGKMSAAARHAGLETIDEKHFLEIISGRSAVEQKGYVVYIGNEQVAPVRYIKGKMYWYSKAYGDSYDIQTEDGVYQQNDIFRFSFRRANFEDFEAEFLF